MKKPCTVCGSSEGNRVRFEDLAMAEDSVCFCCMQWLCLSQMIKDLLGSNERHADKMALYELMRNIVQIGGVLFLIQPVEGVTA